MTSSNAVEFKSEKDDAWYDSRLITERTSAAGDLRLRVKFATFPDDQDEFVSLSDLSSAADLHSLLLSRVRSLSLQLQDSDCSSVRRGLGVCAARSLLPDDRRFFDALIDDVARKEHKVVKGEEVCNCRFIVEWIHGPHAGTLTELRLPAICRVQLPLPGEEIDPALAEFVKAAKAKFETASSVCGGGGGDCVSEAGRKRMRRKGGSSQDSSRARESSTPSLSSKAEITDNSSARGGHDMDIGGFPNMIFVENLEKGISPFTVMAFISQQLSISCQAFVFPTMPLKVYTSATIRLNSKKDFDKLSEFLGNPDHIIISSRGRPWVLSEKVAFDETIWASMKTLKHTSRTTLDCTTKRSNDLKIVTSGSREYLTANQLKELFKDFTDHQCGLHQSLRLEERKISQLAM